MDTQRQQELWAIALEHYQAAALTAQQGWHNVSVASSYYAVFMAMWVALGDPPKGRAFNMYGDVAAPNLYAVAQQNCLQEPATRRTVMGQRSGSSSSNDDVERAAPKGVLGAWWHCGLVCPW
jgi:hypothetical protein